MMNTPAHGSDAVRFGVSSDNTDVSNDSSPSTTTRRPRRRPGENRERLLNAGITVFGAHGYHAAQTAAIAALAGVPQPHVYANFKTKQDLFLACAEKVRVLLLDTPIRGAGAPYGSGHESASERTRDDSRTDPQHSSQQPEGCSAFLLQCFAAVAEPKLQPALGELLGELSEHLGERHLLEFVSTHAHELLRQQI